MKKLNKYKSLLLIIVVMLMIITQGCGKSTEIAPEIPEEPQVVKADEFDTAQTTKEVIDKSKDVYNDVKDVLKPIGDKVFEEGKIVYDEVKKEVDTNKSKEMNTAKGIFNYAKKILDPVTDVLEEGGKIVADGVREEIDKVEKSQKLSEWTETTINELGLQNHKEIFVDGGDTSGHREPNVRVNIGFGDRDYWAFTNEHGQLTHVIAEYIVLQDDNSEPVNSNGRYYSSMANVPGVEDGEYDRGHVIADSLGGVANAYNITPQQFYLNRHGDQAYMESVIRTAGGASHFVAIIEYPNNVTQTPSNYTFSYIVKGNEIVDSFPNADPR